MGTGILQGANGSEFGEYDKAAGHVPDPTQILSLGTSPLSTTTEFTQFKCETSPLCQVLAGAEMIVIKTQSLLHRS